jgi:mRNA-degrading endonuclease RelE of RelBE toxin-antitoxin system
MRITVCETPTYLDDAENLFKKTERISIVDYLSLFPKSGDVIPGGGGIRKLRWGIEGRGKSGGARLIYYFHSEQLPLYLLTVFGKNEKTNLSKEERNELAKLAKALGQMAQKGQKNG